MRREKKKPGPKEGTRHHAYSDDRRRNQLLAAGGAAGGTALTAGYAVAAHDKQKRNLATELMGKARRSAEDDLANWKVRRDDNRKEPKVKTAMASREQEIAKKMNLRLTRIKDQKKTKWESNSTIKRLLEKLTNNRAVIPWDMVKKYRR